MVALGSFALLAAWAAVDSPAPWELEALIALAVGEGTTGDVVRAVNTLGNIPVWAVLVAIAAPIVAAARGLLAGLLVALSFLADAAALLVKVIVERERPENAIVEDLFGGESFAFPSGHVVRATAFVAAIAWLFAPPAWRLPAALAGGAVAALVMGYARVALGVHWPTDAIGGALLGIGWFAVTSWSLARSRTGGGMDLQQHRAPGG